MGAQNHQPTNRGLTAISAWLSQRVGEGLILVHEANNHLEDAIILGMDKRHVEHLVPSLSGTPSDHLRQTIAALHNSEETISHIQTGFQTLAEAAKIEGYTGNPLASQVGSFELSKRFEGVILRPFVNRRMWQQLEDRIETTNTLGTLEWEASEFQRLLQPTRDFVSVMDKCLQISERDGASAFLDAVEANRVPVRQYGARLLGLWNSLAAMFLYSALIMTELFYQTSGIPSLLEIGPTEARVGAS